MLERAISQPILESSSLKDPHTRRIALIACCKSKKQEATIASELYQGDLFKKSQAYAIALGLEYYILSAELGVVSPWEIVNPYEKTLTTMKPQQRKEWGINVASRIEEIAPEGGTLLVLAGKRYRVFIDYLEWRKYCISTPLEGMGIGKQQAWLKRELEKLQRAKPDKSTCNKVPSQGSCLIPSHQ